MTNISRAPARVTALLAPRPRRVRFAATAVAVSLLLLTATGVASLQVQRDGESLFEHVMFKPHHPAGIAVAGHHTTVLAAAGLGKPHR